jgi:hypothetical protein
VASDPFDQRVARVSLDLVVREAPEIAAGCFESLSRDGTPEWLEPSIPRLAEIWRNQDPQAAIEWLLTLERSQSQGEALGLTVADWGIRDLDAAQRWVADRVVDAPAAADGRLAPPESLLVVGLLPKLSRVHPEIAAEWADRLPLGPGRLAMLRRVANRWMRDDPEAASAWLDTLDVTPEQRAAMRARGPESG